MHDGASVCICNSGNFVFEFVLFLMHMDARQSLRQRHVQHLHLRAVAQHPCATIMASGFRALHLMVPKDVHARGKPLY